jgi:hypothetical protein
VIVVSAALCAGNLSAFAEKRVALVIGNSSYEHVTKLPNPANDVTAISLLLKSAGFEVVQTRQNLGNADMRRAVRDFSDVARDADMAVVFYAGHGIEVDGANYLIPVDATLERDIDVEDETVSLERVLQVIDSAKRLRLVILDACRDNPFRAMRRTMATRSIGRGLARVEPATTDTLIAFAAKAGSVAADGSEIHSPFTSALLKHLATPGLDLRIAFGRVRDEVMKSTGNKQEPFVYGSLGGTTVALLPTPGDNVEPGASLGSQSPSTDPTSRDYELAAQVGTKEAWDSFLAKHYTGLYADLARAQLAKLNASPPAGEGASGVGSEPVTPAKPPRLAPSAPTPAGKKEQKDKTIKQARRCDPFQACLAFAAQLERDGAFGENGAASVGGRQSWCRATISANPTRASAFCN